MCVGTKDWHWRCRRYSPSVLATALEGLMDLNKLFLGGKCVRPGVDHRTQSAIIHTYTHNLRKCRVRQ